MVLDDQIIEKKIDLGSHVFSKNEIIEFATINDPLKFHMDLNHALKSKFKGLVCSGSHAFNFFYVNYWIPLFGESVLAGLSVNNWNFLHPIYMNSRVTCCSSINLIKHTKNSHEIIVSWIFEFFIERKKVQELELKVMHHKELLEQAISQLAENSKKTY